MNIEEIMNRIEGKKSIDEVMEELTIEEYVHLILHHPFSGADADLQEGDERLISDILALIGAKGYSVRHSSEILKVTNELLQIVGRVKI